MDGAAVTTVGGEVSAGPADLLILLPSLAYSDDVLNALPYVPYLGERSLPELAALRDPAMRVVFVTAEEVDPWIVQRTLDDLSGGDERLRRDMHRRLECLVPSASRHAPLADAVLADPQTIAQLHDRVRRSRSALLVNFAASSATDELSEQLGIPAEEGSACLAERWGTKAGSKTVFRDVGVRCPRGEPDVVRSVAAATGAAQRLAAADPPAERVIVRLNASAWADGFGNAVVGCSTLLRTGDLRRSVETMVQPWEVYCRELADGGAIVEEFVADATYCPSAQGRIGRDGAVELLAVHEQILVAGEYLGCRFPVQQDVAASIGDAMTRVGVTLQRHGVRGSFGVDFIVSRGQAYATEINLRKVGPSHVIQAVHALIVGGAGTDGRGSIVGMPVAYVHRRLHRPELFSALNPMSAVAALQRNGLSYDRRTQTGTLLHIMGALGPVGYVETTCVATTPAQARELDEQAIAALSASARDALGAPSAAS